MREIIPPPTTKNRSSHTTRFPLFGCTSRLQSNHDSKRYHKHGLLDFFARLFLYDPIETQISNFLRYILTRHWVIMTITSNRRRHCPVYTSIVGAQRKLIRNTFHTTNLK